VRVLTIYRWKPENFRKAARLFVSIFDGTGPKVVAEAMKNVTVEWGGYAPWSNCMIGVWNVPDDKMVDVSIVAGYMSEVFDMESFPIATQEEWSKAFDMLDFFEKIPLPKGPAPDKVVEPADAPAAKPAKPAKK